MNRDILSLLVWMVAIASAYYLVFHDRLEAYIHPLAAFALTIGSIAALVIYRWFFVFAPPEDQVRKVAKAPPKPEPEGE